MYVCLYKCLDNIHSIQHLFRYLERTWFIVLEGRRHIFSKTEVSKPCLSLGREMCPSASLNVAPSKTPLSGLWANIVIHLN